MTAKKTDATKDAEAKALAEKDAEAKALAEKDAEAKALAEKDAEAKAPTKRGTTYQVADKVAITSKRGTLTAGAEISVTDFSGGQAAFDKMLQAKKIIKL